MEFSSKTTRGGGEFSYLTPDLEIISFAAEQGFAASPSEAKINYDAATSDYNTFD